jgi:HAMP domain-containing protein
MTQKRRRIILINKRFQIRFSIYVSLCLAALCFVYPLLVSNIFDYFFRYISRDPNGPPAEGLLKMREQVLLLLVLSEVFVVAITFLISVFMSHRIAGPLYKLRQAFHTLGDGRWKGQLRFREKDYFPELAEDFNRMVERMNQGRRNEREAIAAAISRIEASLEKPGAARSELEPALISLKKIIE